MAGLFGPVAYDKIREIVGEEQGKRLREEIPEIKAFFPDDYKWDVTGVYPISDDEFIYALQFADGKSLYYANLETGENKLLFKLSQPAYAFYYPSRIDYNPEDDIYVIGHEKGVTFFRFDPATKKAEIDHTFTPPDSNPNVWAGVTFLPNAGPWTSDEVIVGDTAGNLYEYNWKTRTVVASWSGFGGIFCVEPWFVIPIADGDFASIIVADEQGIKRFGWESKSVIEFAPMFGVLWFSIVSRRKGVGPISIVAQSSTRILGYGADAFWNSVWYPIVPTPSYRFVYTALVRRPWSDLFKIERLSPKIYTLLIDTPVSTAGFAFPYYIASWLYPSPMLEVTIRSNQSGTLYIEVPDKLYTGFLPQTTVPGHGWDVWTSETVSAGTNSFLYTLPPPVFRPRFVPSATATVTLNIRFVER